MRESTFQKNLIKKINDTWKPVIPIKVDTENNRSFPDYLVLCGTGWVALEMKRSSSAGKRPNQKYYVTMLDRMSYATFAYPENEQEVLDGVARTFNKTPGCSRIPGTVESSMG